MSERVGGIYYETTLETAGLIEGQRKAEVALKKAGDAGDVMQTRITKSAAAVGEALQKIGAEAAAERIKKTGGAAGDAAGKFVDASKRISDAGAQLAKTGESADQGGKAVAAAGSSADKAAGSIKGAGDAAETAGAEIKKAGDAATAAGADLRESGKSADVAGEGFKKSGSEAAEAGAKGLSRAGEAARAAGKDFEGAGTAASGAGRAIGGAGAAAGKGLGDAGKSARELAHDMRQVAPQVTDIVTQLVGGADPLTILVQQGGQLKDQFGGVKEAAIAIGKYLASLVTPTTALATAAGLIGYALYKGAEQSEELQKALTLTGNTAGVTEGQFNALAESISEATNTSIGSAREALQALVKDGKLSGDTFVSAGTAMQRWAKVSGQSAEELSKSFSAALRDPVGWALRMNEQVRFLTVELYKQAKALQDVGENEKAAALAFDALTAKLSSTTKEVGYLEAAWNGLKRATSEKINLVLSWGREGTPDDALAAAEKRLQQLQGPTPWKDAGLGEAARAAAAQATGNGDEFLQKQILDQAALVESLRATKKLSEDVAAATGEQTRRTQDGLRWAQRVEASMGARARMAKEIAAANAEADRVGASKEDRAAVLASIQERYAGVIGEDQALSRARLAEALANAQRIETATNAGIQRAGQFIEAQHAAGLSSDAAYFATRRSLIEQDAQNTLAAIDAEMQRIAAQKLAAKTGAELLALEQERATKLADLAARRADAEASAQARLVQLEQQEAQRAADIAERNAQARAAAAIALARDTSAQIRLIRDEEIRRAEEGYTRGRLTFEEAEAAKVRAVQNAIEQQKQLEMQRQQTQVQTLQIRAQTTGNPTDQEAAIRGQGQLQIDALNERAQADLDNWQTYADQKVAITEQMEQQIQEVQGASTLAQIAMAQSAAGQMLGVLQRAGKERTAMGKALFLAERALAVATIILNTEMGASKAIGIAGPFGIPLATLIRATGYASAGMVAGLAIADAFGGGRQYGGPVSGDNYYRVNETGRPEMFTASNGSQYLLPTGSGGSITPASEVGGGVQWQIIVNNNAPGATASASVDQNSRTVTIAVNEVASQIADRRGPVWGAMRTTNVQGRV